MKYLCIFFYLSLPSADSRRGVSLTKFFSVFKRAQVRQEEDQKQKIKNELIKGALLHINGLSEDTKIEDIKNFLMDYGQLAWVDLPKDSPQVCILYKK